MKKSKKSKKIKKTPIFRGYFEVLFKIFNLIKRLDESRPDRTKACKVLLTVGLSFLACGFACGSAKS